MATLKPQERSNDVFEQTSFLYGANAAFVEGMYAQYLADPNSVDETWRSFFAGLVERMARERELLASLTHPHIARHRLPAHDGSTR